MFIVIGEEVVEKVCKIIDDILSLKELIKSFLILLSGMFIFGVILMIVSFIVVFLYYFCK